MWAAAGSATTPKPAALPRPGDEARQASIEEANSAKAAAYKRRKAERERQLANEAATDTQ